MISQREKEQVVRALCIHVHIIRMSSSSYKYIEDKSTFFLQEMDQIRILKRQKV